MAWATRAGFANSADLGRWAVIAVSTNPGFSVITRTPRRNMRCRSVVGDHHSGEPRAFLLRDAKLRTPAEQQPGDDPVLARNGRDLGARLLGFKHPTSQKTLRFESAWPADLAALIAALRGLQPR